MEKILVTTDLSANSKAGIRFALQLAAQLKAELVFFHVIELMQPTSWNDKRYKKFAAEKISHFIQKLQSFVKSVDTDNLLTKQAQYAVEIGVDVGDLIIKRARKIKAGYICTSTRGAGKLKKLFGTHASSLIINSPLPLIVVPAAYRQKPIKTLFYASDFSAISKELKIVQNFATGVKANIEVYHYDYLLHVPENKEKLVRKAKSLQAPNLAFNFKRQEVEYSLEHHLKGDIEKLKPSMVVLFTKPNRNWFDRLFVSSEAANMSFNSKVPLLIYRKK
jgi:nucleotide-binding universal stress UspA family protein